MQEYGAQRVRRVGSCAETAGGRCRALVAGDTWRGLACMAGSWIGGSANQLAMKEIFKTSNEEFSKVVAIDVFISNVRTVPAEPAI